MKIVRDSVMENYRRNFYNVYHTHILPILGSYEQERIKKLGIVVVVAVITAILAFSVFACSVNFANTESDSFGEMLLYVAVGIGAFGSWIIYAIRDHFVGKLKKSCMGHIVKVFGNLSWMPQIDLIDDYEVRNCELFERYNHRTSDDSFTGEYKGVNFKICETHMWREEGSGKNRRNIQVFKGVLVKFDFNKSINSKTVIMTKAEGLKFSKPIQILCLIVVLGINFLLVLLSGLTTLYIIFAVIAVALILVFSFKGKKDGEEELHEIKLEDPEFNKHYRAYSTDQVEGRYLITPAFMERFKHIQTAFGAKNAKCAFYDSHILFALSTNKNLFEIGGLFHSLKDPRQMEEFFNELTSIMRLIDRFKLTEHTGL